MGKKNRRCRHRQRSMRHAKKLLRDADVPFEGSIKGVGLALKEAGLVPENVGYGAAIQHVFPVGRPLTKKGLLPARSVDAFYQSAEWRRLARSCKRRDGMRCMKCGATPEDGVRIVSDHVVSLRWDWSKRLDPNNIQNLCNDCNWSKGSLDFTDYRGADCHD